ncbi:MAG TPA: TolC family protein [Puia sp.]|jgi:outer membrane protein TolC|nr:TolC family protein [Puia sp.]
MRYFLLAILFFSEIIQAQTPGPLYRTESSHPTDIREKLVQLAMQNPVYEMADHAALAATYQIKIAKSAYLGLLSAQGNINEFTISKPTYNGTQIPYYYPRYNLALNIPFDIFTRTTNNVKIAQENYYMAAAAKNQKFREIKADVLSKYENYLLARQLVELQGKITQSEYATLKRAESDFSENLIKLDEVERVQKSYINEQVKSLTLQKDLNLAKIEIEKVIGVPIEDVERDYK